MGTVWYCLVALTLVFYVLLDGFDLGAGILHLVVARTGEERRQVLRSIGPVWDGNEVWLLATGGTLFFAFPALYASGFSGFYLPLMIVLWLLVLRGISIEFRNHVHSQVWTPFWDFVFCFSSLLLAIFYGAALGNVVRGVPLDARGYFFEPLWTNFRLVGGCGLHGGRYVADVPRSAAGAGQSFRSSLGLRLSGAGRRRACRAPLVCGPAMRRESVSRLVRLSSGHAVERGLRPVPLCAAGQHESCLRPDYFERQGGRLRPAGWLDLVGDGDDSCFRLLHLPLSPFRRQSFPRRRSRKLFVECLFNDAKEGPPGRSSATQTW